MYERSVGIVLAAVGAFFVACGGGSEATPDEARPEPSTPALDGGAAASPPDDAAPAPADAGDGGIAEGGIETDAGDAGPGCVDLDGDGYGDGPACKGPDCDDQNPLVRPGMLELPDDGLDNDCSGGDLKAATAVGGVYVDVGSPSCTNVGATRGTKATPYCLLERAVVEAYQATPAGDHVGKSIFVAKGTYPTVIGTPRAMRITGGYDGATWTWDATANPTILGNVPNVDDEGSAACRAGPGCSAQCPCIDWDGWVSINTDADVALRGFVIKGGSRPNAPLKPVTVNSSGTVVLADNVIVTGAGLQNVAVNLAPTATNVWLLRNTISAGVPAGTGATATVFGVNNLGIAALFGNRITMGPGRPGSWGAAVQNYGTMRLVANVLNGEDAGGDADWSYGFRNLKTDGPTPSAGTAWAANNVIFAGRGKTGSRGVLSNSPLVLVDNVLGDRVPGALDWQYRPTERAAALDVGFASTTTLLHNAFVQLVYANEPAPPNALANRDLVVHSKQTTAYLDAIGQVNVCTWTGCLASTGNVTAAPGFVGNGDFHLTAQSALVAAGSNAKSSVPGGLATIDVDGQPRPQAGAWDIGIDER